MSSTDNIKKKTTGPQLLVAGLLAGLMTLASMPASAALVTSRPGSGDYIDWGQIGPDSTQLLTLPASVTSFLGVGATVSNSSSGGELWTFVEGEGSLSDFSLGDSVLSTFPTPGPIVIDFATGLSLVGAQIQANDFGPFSGVIAVYDALNQLLETVYIVPGVSNGNSDNSAIFIGVSRATADIRRVVFNITGSTNPEFAINRVALSTTAPVPLPAAAWLLLSGLGGLGLLRRRRAES